MAKTIEMAKWDDGEGVTLTFFGANTYVFDQVELDFGDVDKVLALLQDYQRTPSPFRAVRIDLVAR